MYRGGREERGWSWGCAQRSGLSLWMLPLLLSEAGKPLILRFACWFVFINTHLFYYFDRSRYCTTSTIICSHVGLWGHDGVRQHRGANRAGRGESEPDDLWSLWQKRCVCLHAPAGSVAVSGWRGRLAGLDHCLFYSILLYSVTSSTILML